MAGPWLPPSCDSARTRRCSLRWAFPSSPLFRPRGQQDAPCGVFLRASAPANPLGGFGRHLEPSRLPPLHPPPATPAALSHAGAGRAHARGWRARSEEGERGRVPVSAFRQGNPVLFVTLVGELFLEGGKFDLIEHNLPLTIQRAAKRAAAGFLRRLFPALPEIQG